MITGFPKSFLSQSRAHSPVDDNSNVTKANFQSLHIIAKLASRAGVKKDIVPEHFVWAESLHTKKNN